LDRMISPSTNHLSFSTTPSTTTLKKPVSLKSPTAGISKTQPPYIINCIVLTSPKPFFHSIKHNPNRSNRSLDVKAPKDKTTLVWVHVKNPTHFELRRWMATVERDPIRRGYYDACLWKKMKILPLLGIR